MVWLAYTPATAAWQNYVEGFFIDGLSYYRFETVKIATSSPHALTMLLASRRSVPFALRAAVVKNSRSAMGRVAYIRNRLLLMVFVLFGVTIVIFSMVRADPRRSGVPDPGRPRHRRIRRRTCASSSA